MELRDELRRLTDIGRARRLAGAMRARERAPRTALDDHARAGVDAIVRHAAAHSPLYRERFAGLVGAGPVDLAALPVLDRATLMERFDDLVCDRRLRRDALLEHLDGLEGDALYLGEHRVMTTSGSSGHKAVFVYDRAAWVGIVAQFFRYTDWADVRPRLPRLRIAAVGGGSPTHMSRRCAATIDVGLHRVLSLAVTMPLERIVAALNEFRPQFLNAYPSMAALLAEEQRAGRLRLALQGMSTSSEMRPPELTERLTEAFGVRPVDLFGSTEGLWGCTCEHGAMHLFEDMTVVENVDADGRPVADGERGSRLLVTSLLNRTQPLIRLELGDVMALDRAPCACGRTLVRAAGIDGRADDVVHLAGADGGRVAVHPLQFAVVTADRDVRASQVVQEGERVRVRVVLVDGADRAGAAARLRDRVAARLSTAGVARPEVAVEPCTDLERGAGGKLQMVVADRRAVTSAASATLGRYHLSTPLSP